MKMNLQETWIRLVTKPQADGEYSADFFNRKGREVFAKFAKEKLGVLCALCGSIFLGAGRDCGLTFIPKTGFQAGGEYSANFFNRKGREVFAKFAKEKLGVLCVTFAHFAVQSFFVLVGSRVGFCSQTRSSGGW